MIVSRELLDKKESREFIYFDNVPVFKCPHSKIDSFCVKIMDTVTGTTILSTSKGGNYCDK